MSASYRQQVRLKADTTHPGYLQKHKISYLKSQNLLLYSLINKSCHCGETNTQKTFSRRISNVVNERNYKFYFSNICENICTLSVSKCLFHGYLGLGLQHIFLMNTFQHKTGDNILFCICFSPSMHFLFFFFFFTVCCPGIVPPNKTLSFAKEK